VPHPLRLPTFAATSWYHKKADPKYTDLRSFLDEVEAFAINEYSVALLKGATLSEAEKQKVINRLHAYTGLSKEYLDDTNLRLYVGKYNKELLRAESETVGRLDSRFKSSDYNDIGERYEYDPSYNGAIYGPFTMAINDHLRRNLKYENDLPYEILTGRARPWNYSNVQNRFLNVSETLRQAMTKNPYLKVWIASGYYDLATPYFASEYVVNHMFLPTALRKNITMTYYEAGHMMYIHKPSLIQLKKDFTSFIKQ
ncbi:MAG: carboxypeptidase, partial [Saprospiraceae bacterium]|nr:carboxypeptidase [Saprospiraceae bacterium]